RLHFNGIDNGIGIKPRSARHDLPPGLIRRADMVVLTTPPAQIDLIHFLHTEVYPRLDAKTIYSHEAHHWCELSGKLKGGCAGHRVVRERRNDALGRRWRWRGGRPHPVPVETQRRGWRLAEGRRLHRRGPRAVRPGRRQDAGARTVAGGEGAGRAPGGAEGDP